MNDNSSIHTNVTRDLVNLIDVLVDGEFVEDLKDISLQFKGSSNQRIIDVKKSLKANKIVLYDQVRS
jgi:anaerobic ribonucleoside-triphosphate reductase activating protein